MDAFDAMREQMIADQVAARGLRNPRLLDALQRVPRHFFVPEALRLRAYQDRPLPIGNDQTISQPYIVALMTSLLNLRGDEVVLEIGTGSGYQAAVLSLLAREVHTIERFLDLADAARLRLRALGYNNVFVHAGDGSLGLPEFAPYQGIVVTAAAPIAPEPLKAQLDEGGRLVIPVGPKGGQDLQLWTREHGVLHVENIIPVSFVPLRGELGWREEPES